MAIIVYNRTKEDHSQEPGNYPCYRTKNGNILGNPYTHIKDKKTLIDEMYEKYKSGEDVYLECYCKPERCHCDIIKEKLEKRLLKERIKEAKERRNEKDKGHA